MAGDLFVVRGDLRRLACDAWLLPGEEQIAINGAWKQRPPAWLYSVLSDGGPLTPPPGWGHEGIRVFKLHEGIAGKEPEVWFGNTGGWPKLDPEWYVRGVLQFLEGASASVVAHMDGNDRRRRPLLAFPLVGTGKGGQAAQKERVVKGLLQVAYGWARDHDVDVAIVVKGASDFAAVQRFRRDAGLGQGLGGAQLVLARKLAEKAREGTLVVFFGAGVSAPAGLPRWDELLSQLASRAELSPEIRDRLPDVNVLDRARVIEVGLARVNRNLQQEIADSLKGDAPVSLLHMQLASLPVTDFVTTNYDCRFEAAVEHGLAEQVLAVIPYDSVVGATRRLLKMHGTIDHPADIVLTRDDYLRFPERRGALAGIVQALLITRHMLFVGFSFGDDNFHRIAFDVRNALAGLTGSSTTRFGTAFVLDGADIAREIWGDDLEIIDLGEDRESAIRTQARILDDVLLESTSAVGHLLDDAYASALSKEEKALKKALVSVEAAARDTPASEYVERILREFGHKPGTS